MIVIRCKECNTEIKSDAQTHSCGCPNMLTVTEDTFSAVDLSKVIIVKNSNKKEDINKLDFFGDFDKTMKLMTMLREEKDSMYPKNIQDLFRYDNETIFSYKVKLNEVTIQWLNEDWHYFFTNQKFIPDTTKSGVTSRNPDNPR